VLRHIGSGGMGDVYLADDTKLHRRVALKFLPAKLSSDSSLKARFIREAQAAASLNHPNIVTVYEVDEYKGHPFFVMEYVEGESLEERIREKPPTTDEAIDIAIQVCEGLKTAHGYGVIHRDIKPANILLDRSGGVRLADFGLARVQGESGLTRTGSVMGTVSYMSPELIQGRQPTPAGDLFSLGVMMYRMITGKMPFEGEYEASVIYSIVNETPEPVSSLNSDLSPQLAGIVSKLLEKDVERRYRSAEEVLHDLREMTAADSGPSLAPRGLPLIRNRALRWSLWVLLVIVLVFLAQPLFRFGDDSISERKILVVLPFENLGSPDDEYFADGMTDAITMHLAKFSELGVISRASAMQYKHTEKNIREIADELGASYVLTGTILWDKSDEDSKVRINARLTQVGRKTDLWGDSYERVLERVFELQSEIARNVTGALQVAIREADLRAMETRPTDNLEAYDFYLRGNQYFNHSWDREDIEIATQMYQRAIELDSNFAAAWAMLSRGHESMYWEYYDRSEQRRLEAKQAAERALELRPGEVYGRLALGYYYYHCESDYDQALEEFTLAYTTQPNNAELYAAIAPIQRRLGLLEPAVENFLTALELDPLSNLKAFDVGLTYGLMRQYGEARLYLDRTILLCPDWPLPYVYKAWLHIIDNGDIEGAKAALREAGGRADLSRSQYYWWLARIVETDYQKVLDQTRPGPDTAAYYLHCAQMNRLMGRAESERSYADSARMILEAKVERHPDDARFHSHLGLAYAGLRLKPDAIRHGERAVELLPTTRDAFDAPFLVMNLAETMVIFGEHDGAIRQLEFLLEIPGFVSVPYLQLDPLWRPLRGHPGFKQLLTEAG
jgi:serine/threonine protein kinase/tetratricopeptide (TPR) repeat protein